MVVLPRHRGYYNHDNNMINNYNYNNYLADLNGIVVRVPVSKIRSMT